jgi:hypothetical protein
MRSFLIVIVFLLGCNSSKSPHFNLRHPIYMLADKSLWSGCDQDPAGYEVCHGLRVQEINSGIEQWYGWLDSDFYPPPIIVYSKEKVPVGQVNDLVVLRLERGFCGVGKAACFAYRSASSSSSPEIVFENPSWITSNIMAHECGHVLGRDDNDLPAAIGSVMSYDARTDVTPLDVKMVCDLHPECLKTKQKK